MYLFAMAVSYIETTSLHQHKYQSISTAADSCYNRRSRSQCIRIGISEVRLTSVASQLVIPVELEPLVYSYINFALMREKLGSDKVSILICKMFLIYMEHILLFHFPYHLLLKQTKTSQYYVIQLIVWIDRIDYKIFSQSVYSVCQKSSFLITLKCLHSSNLREASKRKADQEMKTSIELGFRVFERAKFHHFAKDYGCVK